jgi:hypothetical protein
MKSKTDMGGVSLEQHLEQMDSAGIERAFLFAPKVGRKGLPGSFHLPYEIVARAVEKYPGRFLGLAGIDPFEGMNGVRALEDAVRNMGFIGAHVYPHWYDLPPDHAKYYPFYAKCCELGVPIQMQVGQSMVYSKEAPMRSVGRPILLDGIACDFPELKLIGIHVGIPWTDEMIAMAWKHENVYIGSDAHSPKYWPESFREVHRLLRPGQGAVRHRLPGAALPAHRTGHRRTRLQARGPPQADARQRAAHLRVVVGAARRSGCRSAFRRDQFGRESRLKALLQPLLQALLPTRNPRAGSRRCA